MKVAAEAKAKQEAAEQKRLAEQRKADEAEAARLRAEEDANRKVAGFRKKDTADWDIPLMSKVPADWANLILIPDKKAITALIKSGKLSEANTEGWMTIKRGVAAAHSR